MESHCFGEPVPVVTATEDGTDEPSWTVDVIRTSGNVVVGTLLISNATLPPRKNKKNKIVWRLPDSIHGDLPRFGEQDKKRLWELFKEQKKKRRKSQSKSNDKEEGDAEPSSPSTNLLSPPPGFECSRTTATDVSDTAAHLEQVSISSGPPGISTAASSSSQTDRLQRYFTIPVHASTDALASTVGASVFDRFRQLVEGTNHTNAAIKDVGLSLLNAWLDCYSEDATQSLLVGSAHTTAVTPTSRREQWCSVLFFSPQRKKYWTCRGWTAVPVVQVSNSAESMVLMVLNGSTVQMETELLSYTLTVLLQGTTAIDEATDQYVIANAILTLQPTPTIP